MFKSESTKNLISYIKLLLKRNKVKTFIAFLSMCLISLIDVYKPHLTQMILDNGILDKNYNMLKMLLALYLGVCLISEGINITLEYFYSKTKKRVSIELKNKVLMHIYKLSGSYFTEKKTGNMIRILENDMYTIEEFGLDLFFKIILEVFTAVLAVSFMLNIDYVLTIIIISIQAAMIYTQLKFTKVIVNKIREVREIAGDSSNQIVEYISNIMNIVILKARTLFFKKYIINERKFAGKTIKLDLTISASYAVNTIFNVIVFIIIYFYAGGKVISDEVTLGQLIAFLQYSGMLSGPIDYIIKANSKIQQTRVAVDNVYGILNQNIEIPQDNTLIRNEKGFNTITFNKVYFNYNNNEEVLKEVDMEFEKGRITALVGNSGCGKSTITKLIYRLWNVTKGEICIDDIPIESYNLKNLRNNVSIVTQDVFLLDDSIINNIMLKSKKDMGYVYEICERVGISDFVNKLDEKYNTMVGERGIKLSGGQKQRIAIARAIIQDSSVIILDEATAALDNISQRNLIENIKDLIADKIVIVIAHRLSTVRNADVIYVMNNGRIVEEGTHEELAAAGGAYAELLEQ